MKKLEKYFFIAGFISVIYLAWFFYIDGIYMNRPIVFTNGIDPMNLKLSKTTYHRGEMVQAYTSYCKTRPAKGTITWYIYDTYGLPYAPQYEQSVTQGCYPKTGTRIEFDLERIPSFAVAACDYHMNAEFVDDFGYGRKVSYKLQTETFCVVP